MVESVGNAPTSTCLQGKCIACLPRPRKTGKPPWCCPRQAEFWRLCCTGWCAAYWKLARRAEARRAKDGAVAGGCARTCSLARSHSAVKSQPRKVKGRELRQPGGGPQGPPGPCHFNKEQTPLGILRYQPTVSRWFFRCLGAHLLRSP